MDLLRKFGSTGLIFRSKVRTNGGNPSTNWSIMVIWIGIKGKIKIHSDRPNKTLAIQMTASKKE
ncbi:hypothetical protein AFP21_14945 [Staphylococcus aureus]|nr:hypothetical protein AFP21_14945 [Staphylococcus aureus]